jgi:hypothetical protein
MHESIEGEVIIIDLDTGSYYSLRDEGAAIWAALEGGADQHEIVAELERRYEPAGEPIDTALRRFVEELANEGLIAAASASDGHAVATARAAENGDREVFRAPVLEKHTDMQELILLDPVHQVDTRGWPYEAPTGTDGA